MPGQGQPGSAGVVSEIYRVRHNFRVFVFRSILADPDPELEGSLHDHEPAFGHVLLDQLAGLPPCNNIQVGRRADFHWRP